jgi:hypothetical protein
MDLATTTSSTFYEDLVAVMTHQPFKEFLQKYTRTWSDAETSLMFIKLYQKLAEYTDDHDDVIRVINKIMCDRRARRNTIDNFKDFQEGRRIVSNPGARKYITDSHH